MTRQKCHILAENTAIQFGSAPLFSGLSFSVGPGEVIGLRGPSGSGKTSLLRALLGFVPVSSGRMEVCGMEVGPQNIDAIRRLTSYLPQEMLLPAPTVRDMIAMTCPKAASETDAERLAMWESLDLAPSLWQTLPAQLSGGQRQRILLATALQRRRPVCLLDEPTSALDTTTAQRVIGVLHTEAASRGIAFFVASHDARLLDECHTTITLRLT